MKTFKLPDLGEGLPDAEIVNWLVKEGDTVELDQPMVEMETAKAVVEVPSPFSGVISKFYGQAGDVILTGAPLVDIDDGSGTGTATGTATVAETPEPKTAKAEAAPETAVSASSANGKSTGGQVFKLPDLGEGLPDAEIVNWLVNEGDTVKMDQPMVEMETAKAVVEVPSPFDGVIEKFFGQAGDVIITGAPLVSFVGENASNADSTPSAEPEKTQQKADAATVVGAVVVGNTIAAEAVSSVSGSNAIITPVIKALARKLKVDLSTVKATGANNAVTQSDVKNAAKACSSETSSKTSAEVILAPSSQALTSGTENPLAYKASPAVRALAGRLGVNLASCQATGKKGTITREDINKASHTGQQPGLTQITPSGSGLPNVQVTVTPKPVRGVRRAMAMSMSASHASVVPVTLMDDADISRWPKGTDATTRMLRAIAYAARVEPALNGWFDGEKMEVLHHPEVHVGVAVDTPAGLYVPVLQNIESKTATELRVDLDDKMDRISKKAIRPNELSGATISLTNYGTIAGRYGTPIVVPPQMAILGAGRYRDELKMTDKGISKHRMLPLSLSFDHRACTGGEGARFLAALIVDLQQVS